MRKLIVFCFSIMLAAVANAQYYSVGTSTTGQTDIFGNTTTTHRNSYGQSTGTSTTGRTDMFGNTTTQQRSNTGFGIWTW